MSGQLLFTITVTALCLQRGANASIVNIVDQRVLKPTPRFLSYTLSKSKIRRAHYLAP